MAEDKVLRTIQNLLERAGHPETPGPEREACQAKADAMMQKHRIERAMLNFDRKDSIREIVARQYDRIDASEYTIAVNSIRQQIFDHAGCKSTYDKGIFTAVGYEEDHFYAGMLWASVHMDFIGKMFPRWEDSKGFDANVYDIKSGGYSWPEVREMGIAKEAFDVSGLLTRANAGSKLRTAFKREAKRRGVEVLPGRQQPSNTKLWRDSYAEGYERTLQNRLRVMREAANASSGEQGAIALVRDSDRVLAEFYLLFPHLHPDAQRQRIKEMRDEEIARRAAMTQEERDAEDREAERRRKMWERLSKPRRADMSGWQAGTRAAANVNLSATQATGTGRAGELS